MASLDEQVTSSSRPAPWPVVLLAASLVAVLGVGAATAVHRSGSTKPSTVSIGLLTAAQAKTAQANDYSISMTINLSVSGQHITERLAGELSEHPFEMSLNADLPGGFGRLEERAIGQTIYMRTGKTSVNGKRWVAYTMPKGSKVPSAASDPLQSLQTLTGADGAVHRAGTTKINGVQTKHYTAKLDLKKVLSKLPQDLSQALGANRELLNSLPDIPVDVYIADDGTIRRMVEQMNFAGTNMNLQLDVTPLGHHARVVAPPASEVATVSSIAQLESDAAAGAGLG